MKWKNLRIAGKFTIGFGSVVVLLIAICVVACIGMAGIVRDAAEVIDGNALRGNTTQKLVDHLNWANNVASLLSDSHIHELSVETDPHKCAFGKWYYGEGRIEAEALVPQLRTILDAIEEPHNQLHQSAIDIDANYVNIDAALGAFLREKKVDHLAWIVGLQQGLIHGNPAEIRSLELDHTNCGLGKWLYSDNLVQLRETYPEIDVAFSGIFAPHEALHASADEVASLIESGDFEAANTYFAQTTVPLANNTLAYIDSLVTWHDDQLAMLDEANRIYADVTSPALREIQTGLNNVIQTVSDNIMTDEVMLKAAEQTQAVVVTAGIAAAILAIILAVVIAVGIIRPIRQGVFVAQQVALGDLTAKVELDQKDEIGQLAVALNAMVAALGTKAELLESIAEGDLTRQIELASEKDNLGISLKTMSESLNNLISQVRKSVDQVASGSDQVSQSSQALSQGATEQASSLEEISSSLDEINSQARRNAETGEEANAIATKANEAANGGNSQMQNLVDAIGRISDSAEETKKVVKVIDDIAFQINLLALNANVEAARAGKYGKGFAVVAEEVRNLAVRSGDAVKETTIIVDGMMSNMTQGAEAAHTTARQLEEIVQGSSKVAELLAEIALASKEQAQGVEQINAGLEQIDQVTQSNTASAEQSASASEELASQAEQLKAMVARFAVKSDGTEPTADMEPMYEIGRSRRISTRSDGNGAGAIHLADHSSIAIDRGAGAHANGNGNGSSNGKQTGNGSTNGNGHSRKRVLIPEHVIALNDKDDDFGDF